jgi:hypothetical protein
MPRGPKGEHVRFGSKAEVAPVERHVRSFLNNGRQDHSLVPIGRLVAFDPRSGFSSFKKTENFEYESGPPVPVLEAPEI